MPNHCNNQLKLKSGEDILNVINPYLIDNGDGDYDVDFDKIIPEPKGEEEENWYQWRIDNWGTKWAGYDGQFNDEKTEFRFSTAWNPPLPVIKKLAELTGETLILEYIEEGVYFCGRYVTGKHGSYDEYYRINEAPQELKDSLGFVPWEEEEEEVV